MLETNHLASSQSADFYRPLSNCSLSFPEDEKAPHIIKDPPTPCRVSNYILEAICTVEIEFLFVRENNFSLFLSTHFSHFSLCFIVKLRRWILLLCLICSLFKCLQIALVLQRASIRDFDIFDVVKVFFFTARTILLLNCGDHYSRQPVSFLVRYLFGLFK